MAAAMEEEEVAQRKENGDGPSSLLRAGGAVGMEDEEEQKDEQKDEEDGTGHSETKGVGADTPERSRKREREEKEEDEANLEAEGVGMEAPGRKIAREEKSEEEEKAGPEAEEGAGGEVPEGGPEDPEKKNEEEEQAQQVGLKAEGAAGEAHAPKENSKKARKERRQERQAQEVNPLIEICGKVSVLEQQHKVIPNLKLPGHVACRYRPLKLTLVQNVEGCDLCLLNHRNGLFIVCLAPSHEVITGAAEDGVVAVDFTAKMVNARPSGKKKLGAVGVSPRAHLCNITLASGKVIAIPACVAGIIAQVNQQLKTNPGLVVSDPLDTGYLAIIHAKDKFNMQAEKLFTEMGFADGSIDGATAEEAAPESEPTEEGVPLN